jgi:hypothetical protein
MTTSHIVNHMAGGIARHDCNRASLFPTVHMLVTIQIKHLWYVNTYRYCSSIVSSEGSQEVGLVERGKTRRGFEVELTYPRDAARSPPAHVEINAESASV